MGASTRIRAYDQCSRVLALVGLYPVGHRARDARSVDPDARGQLVALAVATNRSGNARAEDGRGREVVAG